MATLSRLISSGKNFRATRRPRRAPSAIAGCTAFIDAGSHSPIELAQAFANRAYAFATKRDTARAIADYEARVRRDLLTGKEAALALPASLVVALELESGARIVARTSGTEPKAKIYLDVREPVAASGGAEAVSRATERAGAALRRLAAGFSERVGF